MHGLWTAAASSYSFAELCYHLVGHNGSMGKLASQKSVCACTWICSCIFFWSQEMLCLVGRDSSWSLSWSHSLGLQCHCGLSCLPGKNSNMGSGMSLPFLTVLLWHVPYCGATEDLWVLPPARKVFMHRLRTATTSSYSFTKAHSQLGTAVSM